MKKHLLKLRKIAIAKLATNEEPPWARENYRQLVTAIDVILNGLDATMSLEDSQQSALPDNVHLLKDYIERRDNPQRRHDQLVPQLPM